ncbi:MAG: MoxR family ATPase [Chloroflexi bacterium]|nr:MoxR family ATPase [Chloroflexota bacterium]
MANREESLSATTPGFDRASPASPDQSNRLSADDARRFSLLVEKVRADVRTVIVGATDTLDLALVAMLAGGHMLVEDVPGTGKTTMMKALAVALGCSFNRIQGTPDLLPTDVSGVSVYNPTNSTFTFRPGPIFGQVVLVDEINRATPRTQAAFLEAMAEGQVSADGETRQLPRPFLVLATQNPIELEGTFPLPEAQLDRFLIRASMGYPTRDDEVEIVRRFAGEDRSGHRGPTDRSAHMDSGTVLDMQAATRLIHVSDAVAMYATDIVRATRQASGVAFGASPRATVGLVRAARARALLQGRSFVLPDDIQHLATPVLAHRLVLDDESRLRQVPPSTIIQTVIVRIDAPVEPPATGPSGANR